MPPTPNPQNDGLIPDAGTIDAIVQGRHSAPFGVLGRHRLADGWCVRAFLPSAEAATLLMGAGEEVAMTAVHEAGLFACRLAEPPGLYRIAARRGADEWRVCDPYQFGPILGELDEHLFSEGTHRRLWRVLGAHPRVLDGVAGVGFAVWAPNAGRVSVVGDFNGWDGRRHVMRTRGATGIWEIFLPDVAVGARYKFEILDRAGKLLPSKADPVGFGSEMRPGDCSVVTSIDGYAWGDGDWMARRGEAQDRARPISIYEAHLGSWRRGEDGRWLTYRELAEALPPYVRDMGFTHIELLPVSEHPFDGSWGYQPIGLFAPTSRFGSPDDFRAFVDACHAHGLGVILDWVPGHFPTDAHGLGRFDGTPLYEHADPREGFQPDWNTLIYNFGRKEVANYLIANAIYWLEAFHIDGLRVDAVASMLYRDYSRKEGEWIPNAHGGRENLEAVAFLKEMNVAVYGEAPGIMTIAEESTAWPGVSRPAHGGGLGFGYKWNMGWMHDTLEYMQVDPVFRGHHHGQMTFGLHYAFSENFVLPLSHDEVVHGKGSIFGRMPGQREDRFANLRAYLGFMFAHPGKKLLFMGQEFAQPGEWSHEHGLPWELLGDPKHAGVQALVRDLNRLYRERPALHRLDATEAGFEWIDGAAGEANVFVWARHGGGDAPPILAIMNFSGVERRDWRIGAPAAGYWTEILNTDAETYGGGGRGNLGGRPSEPIASHGRPQSIVVTLPPLSTIYFERRSD